MEKKETTDTSTSNDNAIKDNRDNKFNSEGHNESSQTIDLKMDKGDIDIPKDVREEIANYTISPSQMVCMRVYINNYFTAILTLFLS